MCVSKFVLQEEEYMGTCGVPMVFSDGVYEDEPQFDFREKE